MESAPVVLCDTGIMTGCQVCRAHFFSKCQTDTEFNVRVAHHAGVRCAAFLIRANKIIYHKRLKRLAGIEYFNGDFQLIPQVRHDTGSGSHRPPRFDEDRLREVATMELVAKIIARPHAVGFRHTVRIVWVSAFKRPRCCVPRQTDSAETLNLLQVCCAAIFHGQLVHPRLLKRRRAIPSGIELQIQP